MGVHTEPAQRADDAGRRVPGMIRDAAVTEGTAAATARGLRARLGRNALRQASQSARQSVRHRVRRGTVVTLLGGLALGASLPTASAHDAMRDGAGLSARLGEVPARSDLRTSAQPAEWGDTALRAGEAATRSVYDADPGSALAKADAVSFGAMRVPRELVETILRAAEATGVDPVYMMALADKESSFDTDVKASTSSAQGLFQFVTGTWLEMIRDYGAKHGLAEEAAAVKGRGGIGVADPAMRKRILALRNDPYVAGLMAGELVNRDRAKIEARIGRPLSTPELYLAHFLGTADAGRLLELRAQDPARDAQRSFASAARANRTIFTQRDGQKRRGLSVAEVHERLGDMIDKRLDRYQDVAAMAAFEDLEHPDEPVLDARLRLKQEIVPPAVAPVVQ